MESSISPPATIAASVNTLNTPIVFSASTPMVINIRADFVAPCISKGELIAKSCRAVKKPFASSVLPMRYLKDTADCSI